MGKNKKIFLLSLLLGLFLFFGVNIALALEIDYPRLPGAIAPQDFINTAPAEKLPLLFVQYIFNFFLWISGVVALGLFIYSGVLFLISAGNAEKLLEARSRITAVFFGLLLLFGSVVLFKTLNPDILIKTSIQTPPPVQTSIAAKSSLSPSGEFLSALSAELPFGTIIEKNVLEVYAEPGKGKPRMERIKNIGENTVKLAMILKENSEQLEALVQQCSCDQAQPVCTDACTPAGASSALGALSPQGLASFTDITGRLSETLGQDNLSNAFQLDDSIAGAIQNSADFVKITDSLNSIAGITNSANLSQLFQAATNIAGISIADPGNLTGLFGSLSDATKLWGADFGNLINTVQPLQGIINNPTNIGGVMSSVNGLLSGLPGTPNLADYQGINLLRIGDAVQQIASDPTDIGNILLSANNITGQFGKDMTSFNGIDVLKIGNSLQGIMENPQDIGNALLYANQMMSGLPGAPNLNNVKGLNIIRIGAAIQNAASDPGDIGNVLFSINSLFSQIPGTPRLTNINNVNVLEIGNAVQQIFDNQTSISGFLSSVNGLMSQIPGSLRLSNVNGTNILSIGNSLQGIVNNRYSIPAALNSFNGLMMLTPGSPNLTNIKGINLVNLMAPVQNIMDNSANSTAVLGYINQISLRSGGKDITDNLKIAGNTSGPLQRIQSNPGNLNNVLNSINQILGSTGGPDLNNVSGINVLDIMSSFEETRYAASSGRMYNLALAANNTAGKFGVSFENINGNDVLGIIRSVENVRDQAIYGSATGLLSGMDQLTGGLNINFSNIGGLNIIDTMRPLDGIISSVQSGDTGALINSINDMTEKFGVNLFNVNGVDIMGIMSPVSGIINNAQAGSINGLMGSINLLTGNFGFNLTNINGLNLVDTMVPLQGILSSAQTGDINSLMLSLNRMTGNFGVNLADINGINILGIMSPVQGVLDSAQAGDIKGMMSSLNKITGNFGVDLTNIQGINALNAISPFAALINNPLDLANIKDALSVLSQSFPGLSGLQAVLGDMQGIADIIKNPADFANIMNYSGAISAIAPQQFGQVLADLNQLNGLFPGAQNIMATFLGGSCTCDPCKNPRPQIQAAEQKNLGAIYLGAQITSGQQNASQQTSNLIEEQNKSTEEIRLLREELGKLENAEKIMFECPLSGLSDLSEHLFTMEVFMDNKWFYSDFNFWKKIIIDNDWATFYCQVSGNTAEPATPAPESSSFEQNNNSAKRNPLISFIINTASAQILAPGSSQDGPFACSIEVPVGEIIDRTQRTGAKIIERLEALIKLDEQLIEAVDKLHSLVSQCTSQVPRCRSICIPVYHDGHLVACIKKCVGSPCPLDKIAQQVQIINGLVEGGNNNSQESIKDVVEAPQIKSDPSAPTNKEKIEKIGLTTVIEKVVPEILKDLGNKVREPMKKCSVEVSSQKSVNHLLSCRGSAGNIGPDGKLLENCCFNEDAFKKCLDECYLESGQTEKKGTLYKNCLTDCLKIEGQKINSKDIPTCHHLVNFYCCGI